MTLIEDTPSSIHDIIVMMLSDKQTEKIEYMYTYIIYHKYIYFSFSSHEGWNWLKYYTTKNRIPFAFRLQK